MVLAVGMSVSGLRAAAGEGGAAPAPAAKVQTTCPVMGGKIDKRQYVDVKGKRIYVCCAGCKEAIRKDPDAALRKLEAAGVVVEAAPVPKKGE